MSSSSADPTKQRAAKLVHVVDARDIMRCALSRANDSFCEAVKPPNASAMLAFAYEMNKLRCVFWSTKDVKRKVEAYEAAALLDGCEVALTDAMHCVNEQAVQMAGAPPGSFYAEMHSVVHAHGCKTLVEYVRRVYMAHTGTLPALAEQFVNYDVGAAAFLAQVQFIQAKWIKLGTLLSKMEKKPDPD